MLAALLTPLMLAGCDSEGLLISPTPVPGAAATAARAAATPLPTRAQAANPTPVPAAPKAPLRAPSPAPVAALAGDSRERIQAVVTTIDRAIASQNTALLEPLMLNQVAIASQEAGGGTMAREQARAWLAERLGPGIKVLEWRTVEHFGLVEVITETWPQRPPLSTGRVTFNLHQFDSQGVQDAVGGDWKIDVIIAE